MPIKPNNTMTTNKITTSPVFRKFLRFGSIFTATILLVFIVSSFKVKDTKYEIAKSCGPATFLNNSVSTSYTSDVDYQLYYFGTPIAGASGTLCAGASITIPVASTDCAFDLTGTSPLGFSICNASCSYNTPSPIPSTYYANSISCSIPITPVPGLKGVGGMMGANSKFDFN